MFCQSCGTENPSDARFCKYCGTSIAQPGAKGGLIVGDAGPSGSDVSDGETTLKDPPREAPGHEAATDEAPRDPKAAVTTLAGLRTGSTGTLTNASLSMASLSLRSPVKSWLAVSAIALGLIGVGAATMFGVMLVYSWNTATIVATPQPRGGIAIAPVPVEIGTPEGERVVQADLLSGAGSATSEAPSKTGDVDATRQPSEVGEVTPEKASGVELPSGSSSTTVEAPAQKNAPPSKKASPREPAGGENDGGPTSSSQTTGSTSPAYAGDLEEGDIEMRMYAGHVRGVIRDYYAVRAQNCFDRATRNNHNLRGTVVVQFRIGADGNVQSARPMRNSTGDEDLGQCVAGQVNSWRLPQPPDGEPVDMQMPFSW